MGQRLEGEERGEGSFRLHDGAREGNGEALRPGEGKEPQDGGEEKGINFRPPSPFKEDLFSPAFTSPGGAVLKERRNIFLSSSLYCG